MEHWNSRQILVLWASALVALTMVVYPPTVMNGIAGPVSNGYNFLWNEGLLDVSRLAAQLIVLAAISFAALVSFK